MNAKTLHRIFLLILPIVAILASGIAPARAASDSEWRARYWNNRKLSGEPVLQRNEATIDHDWGGGSPARGVVDDDNFSAKWTRRIELPAGNYRFFATTDDGMRVWIDEQLLIDSWYDGQERTIVAERQLGPGEHFFRVEFYEAGGVAVARFLWTGVPTGPTVFNGWRGQYYNNAGLREPPLYIRDDPAINFDWGLNAPISGFSADNFSVRWTRTLDFAPGVYRFTVKSDDGVRLWVNNQLVVDAWRDQAEATFTADVALPGGPVPLKLEYYDSRDRAMVSLNWTPSGAGVVSPIVVPPVATPLPIVTPAPVAPAGLYATMTGALYLNVRSGPSVEAESIDHLSRGQTVPLTGFKSPGGFWVEIRLPDGRTGWVSSRYMTLGTPLSGLTTKTN